MNYRGGYYVELGANDGKNQSNSIFFERTLGWTGVLIEPTPNNYLLCKKNRSRKSNKIFCAACVPFDFDESFIRMTYGKLVSTPFLEGSSIDPIHRAKDGEDMESSEIPIFGAVARPLNDILTEAGAPRNIDLLSLDVEGGELGVLKGVDFQQFSFRFILVETETLSEVSIYLESFGYEMVSPLSHHDYLFQKHPTATP